MFTDTYSCTLVCVKDVLKQNPAMPMHTQPCSETYHELSEEDDIFTSKLCSALAPTAADDPTMYEPSAIQGTCSSSYFSCSNVMYFWEI